MTADQHATLPKGSLFGERYEIVRAIGSGGMGVVYEVFDQRTERKRALKVMHERVVADELLRRRFAREATVAARIESEHICEVLDAGVDEERAVPFIVLELLKGASLADVVAERGALPPGEVVRHLWQAASALDQAHADGVVHRDLKPENLFVTRRDDGSPKLKVLDFGIAKVTKGTQSGPGTQGVLGTPLYMSPEQAHGEEEITPRADVYAMTLVAYTLLVGEAYFEPELRASDSVIQFVMKVLKGLPEHASKRARDRRDIALPAAFDAWFERGASDKQAQRPATVGELVRDLARALDEEDAVASGSFSWPPVSSEPASDRPAMADTLPSTPPTAVAPEESVDARPSETLSSTVVDRSRPAPRTWASLAAGVALVAMGGGWLLSSSGATPTGAASTTPTATDVPSASAAPETKSPSMGPTAAAPTSKPAEVATASTTSATPPSAPAASTAAPSMPRAAAPPPPPAPVPPPAATGSGFTPAVPGR